MEFKRVIGENVYRFECYTWETRYSWGHECTLYKNGMEVAYSKARYYNRTWESYQYHSVIDSCIYDLKEKRKDVLKKQFLEKMGLKRMSPKAKATFDNLLLEDATILELTKLKLKMNY